MKARPRPTIYQKVRGLMVLGLFALVLAVGWTGVGQAQVSFAPKADFVTGAGPDAVALGDVNGDGKLDLVVANATGGSVSVLLGDGLGAFGAKADFVTGAGPAAVALGDVDRDGKLDIAVVNFTDGSVSVLLGDGLGAFGAKADFVTGAGPAAVALGDVDRDGKLDIVVANATAGSVSVLLGNGLGGFGAKADFPAGASPVALALVDLNADTFLDIAVANSTANTVTVLLGNGLGSFAQDLVLGSTFPTGTGPVALAIGDIEVTNGNPPPLDLVVVNSTANTISYLKGGGNGTFAVPGGGALSTFATGTGPSGIAIADFDGDGSLDAVVTNRTANSVSFLRGLGTGIFNAASPLVTGTQPTAIAVADLNGDRKFDIVVVNSGGNSVSVLLNATDALTVFKGGSGTGSVTSTPAGISCGTACRAIFAPAASVTLTAAPALGSTFLGWTGEGCTGTGTCTVTQDRARNVVAMFDGGGTDGFTQAALAGTWNFSEFTDFVSVNDPGWVAASVSLDAGGAVIGGTYTDSTGATGAFTGGTFLIDSAGLVSGSLTSASRSVTYPHGKLDRTKTILAVTASEDLNGRGMALGIKAGGSFATSDLAGDWFVYYLTDSVSSNTPFWAATHFALDALGNMVCGPPFFPVNPDPCGTFSDSAPGGGAATFSAASFTLDSAGLLSGSLTTATGISVTLQHGNMSLGRNMFAAVIPGGPSGPGVAIGVKGGGTFARADLAGTWSFSHFWDLELGLEPGWVATRPTLDTAGKVVSGTFTNSSGPSGSLSKSLGISTIGEVSGSLDEDDTTVIPNATTAVPFGGAKMDPSKTIIAGVATDTQNLTGMRIVIGIKGGPVVAPNTLAVTMAGNGSGSVTSSPAVVNCAANCTVPIDAVLSLTLTANPATGSTFTGWSGDCTGTGTCTVFMNQAHNVTATYTLQTFPLTVLATGTGVGTVSPIAAGTSSIFNFGTVVTLTATPGLNTDFAGWSGGGCTGTGSCLVTVSGATTVTATFNLSAVPLSVVAAGNGSGTVSPVAVGASTLVIIGNSVTLTATPATGSNFTGWSGGGCAGTAPCTVTPSAATTVTATFTLQRFALTVANAGNGSGAVAQSPLATGTPAQYDFGTAVTLTASPATGSNFTGWTGGGCTGTASCVTTISGATSVTATFTLQQFTLTVNKAGVGSGGVASTPAGINCGLTCNQTLNFGTSVTLTATPAAGSVFTGWTGGGCTGTASCLTTVTAATSVTATFGVPLTVSRAGGGTGSVTSAPAAITCGATCSSVYTTAAAVTLTATPATGSVFAGWTGACTGTGTCSVTMSQAQNVTATFQVKAALTSPTSGSVLPGTAATFNWSAGTGATEYILWVGTTAGHNQLYSKSQGLNLSVTLPNLPSNGVPVFVRLFTRFGTTLLFSDYTFTAATQFSLSVVAAGTGTGTVSPIAAGSSALINTGTAVTLTATPAVGSLFTGWSGGGCTGTGSCTVTVTAPTTVTATFTFAKAALTSPTSGSVLPGTSATFNWSAGTGATDYVLWVGTTAGRNNLYSKSQGLNLSVTVPNLPSNGVPVFVRLFTRFGTTLLFTDYTFTAATQFSLSVVAAGTGTGTVSPIAAGSSALINTGTAVTLTATPAVGSLFTGWSGGGCTGTGSCTVTVTAPTTVTATFTSAKAALTSPTSGSVLPGTSATFNWSAGTGATDYVLWVGTTAGRNNLYSGSQGLNLSRTVPNLPGNGVPVFVRLFTRFGTTLLFTDYTFTAATQFSLSVVAAGTGTGTVSPIAAGSSAPVNTGTAVTLTATPAVGSLFTGWSGGGCTGTASCTVTVTAPTTVTATFTSAKAALVNPAPGSVLPGTSVTFNWSAGTGATEYILWVGTTAGHNQLYSKSQGLNLSVTLPNLPSGGVPVFVRLFTRVGTTLLFTDYTFTAAP